MDSGKNHAKRLFLVAPLENHATVGRVAALAGTPYSIAVGDVSIANFHRETCYPFDRIARVYPLDAPVQDPIYSSTGRRRFVTLLIDWLRAYGVIPESRHIARFLRAAIRETNPEILVTFYGPIAIHYARMLKRICPEIPVIIILNLIPSTIESSRNPLTRRLRHLLGNEFADFRRWLRHMDGIVYASEEMREFVNRKFEGLRAETTIAPDYLPAKFQSESAEASSDSFQPERPAVIFVGAPERYGGTLDAPDHQFVAIAEAGIHVYSATMSDEALASPLCHRYPRLSNHEVFTGKLAEYARGFDAVLITYNRTRPHERFRSTYPTRFLSALTTGIPIAIRGGVYDACERFIGEHGNGFVFHSVAELAAVLSDPERMASLRQRAEALRPLVTAESQATELAAFIERVKTRFSNNKRRSTVRG